MSSQQTQLSNGTSFLKNLEIVGFKSFAEKTLLEFKEGITAVVGPNGSGKSNIVEAFRFVLGERESKNLRSEKSEDLIFAGNEKRPASGFAEVKITFNNKRKLLPVEYEEIEIKRHINRDGISAYYLNKSQVRLKDIIELLSKTKLGTKGLGIINQGEADSILKSNPQERKAMVEEILGLKQFQLKKQETSRRLDAAKNNLEQAKSLMEEILPHLRSLKRQTNRWEKRSAILENLKSLEFQYFKKRFLIIQKNKKELKSDIEKAMEEIIRSETDIRKIEEIIEKQEKNKPADNNEISAIDQKINILIEEKNKLSKNLGRLEALIEDRQKNVSAPVKTETPSLLRMNSSILISSLKEIRLILEKIRQSDDIPEIKQKLEEIISKIDSLFKEQKQQPELTFTLRNRAEIDAYIEDQKKTEIKITEITNQIQALQQELKSLKLKNEQQNAAFYDLVKQAEALRFVQREKERRLNELRLEAEKEKLKEENFNDDLKKNNWQIEELMLKIQQETAEMNPIRDVSLGGVNPVRNLSISGTGPNFSKNNEADISNGVNQPENTAPLPEDGSTSSPQDGELEEKIYKLRKEIYAIGEIDELILEEAKNTEERYNFLKKQSDDLTRAIADLEKLTDELTQKIDEELKIGVEKINQEFGHFFQLMFGIGKAKLYFSRNQKESAGAALLNLPQKKEPGTKQTSSASSGEEEKTLPEPETGIEISVYIPRKRIKSVEMLSGGEKALVSIALLFAVVSAAEPPFLILDEIDAALDQRNTKIFTKILQELSQKTQFILVTHNNITMETADILYGVTMGPDGISKILSLRLNIQPQSAETAD